MSDLWGKCSTDSAKIELINCEAELWRKSKTPPNTSIPNRVFQVFAQTGTFAKIEEARQRALEKCNARPFKCFKDGNVQFTGWGQAIYKFLNKGNKCKVLIAFSAELRKELRDIYNIVKKRPKKVFPTSIP